MWKMVAALAIAGVVSGCTTLAPGANRIWITTNPADVAGCHPVGSISSSPPYVMPGDDYKQMRNQAVALGANAILRTGPRLYETKGVAYRCSGG